MNPLEEHAAELAGLEGESPDVILWRGVEYPVLASGSARSQPLAVGGFSDGADVTFVVRRSVFVELELDAEALRVALLNTRLSHRAQIFKVDSVTIAPGGNQIRITARAANERA